MLKLCCFNSKVRNSLIETQKLQFLLISFSHALSLTQAVESNISEGR